MPPSARPTRRALRVRVIAAGAGRPEAIRAQAGSLGLWGWVRGDAAPGEPIAVHAEGDASALEELVAFLRAGAAAGAGAGGGAAAGGGAGDAGDTPVAIEAVRAEGHEQFAVRGVSAGAFVVQEHRATAHHYDLRLEVDGVMRSWAVPKGPSLDPAVKRLAVQVNDHSLAHNAFEGAAGGGAVIVWDRGTYEQGGRVPWPEALERGHAVFVLHGAKLSGGFALQRTGRSSPPQWLLVKRRDDAARPGSDVTAERPESVASGRTLAELLDSGDEGA